MRKFTIVVAIAFFCSFAVVRRKQDEDQAEAAFREAVTHVVEEEAFAAFHAMGEEESIGNGTHPLQDQPVYASSVLNGAFNEVIRVDNGIESGWLVRSEIRSSLFRKGGDFVFYLN